MLVIIFETHFLTLLLAFYCFLVQPSNFNALPVIFSTIKTRLYIHYGKERRLKDWSRNITLPFSLSLSPSPLSLFGIIFLKTSSCVCGTFAVPVPPVSRPGRIRGNRFHREHLQTAQWTPKAGILSCTRIPKIVNCLGVIRTLSSYTVSGSNENSNCNV